MGDAQPIKIGPFTGGMNTYSDPSAIADSEAVLIQNYDVDIDGSLISRRPIVNFMSDSKFTDAVVVGTYRQPNGNNWVIFSTIATKGTYAYLMGSVASPTLITNTISASVAVQYDSKVWLVAPVGEANNGGGWDGTTFTANTYGMPKGNTACIYKERMWIGQSGSGNTTSTMYFCLGLGDTSPGSNGGGPGGTWNVGTDYITIAKGDGQTLTAIRTFNNVIVAFKSNSTYIFAYDSAPTRGTVQQISSMIGMTLPFCSVEYENSLFLLSGENVYQIQNWNFELINIKMPFVYQNANPGNAGRQPIALSIVGNSLYVRYYDNTYVYNLKTRAWTIWTSTWAPCRWIKDPNLYVAQGVSAYYALSYRNNVTQAFRIYDGLVTGAVESTPYQLKLLTKSYSVEVPYTFKRLFWWGVECFSKVSINAKVIPIVYARPVSWQYFIDHNLMWNQLGTWARPVDISIDVTDSATMTTVGNTRTFLKFWKSLRFRQAQFQLDATITGDTSDSPQNIYSLVAVVGNKQVVPDKVN